MGNFFCGGGRGLSLGLQERAKEFLRNEKNQKEIIDYFNSFKNWSKPNDKTQNSDKAIVKIYKSNENGYNLNIHIYNIPGLLRLDNGLFKIISENLILFQLFFNKYNNYDKDEYQKEFDDFFDAILEINSQKIYDKIGVNIDENNLLKRKQGLECLMNIFGMENVRYYYKIAFFVPIGVGGTLVLGTLVGFGLTSTLTVATGVGAAIGILVIAGLAGYFIYRHIKNKHQDKLKENAKMLEDFYDKVLGFLSSGVDYFCENKGNIISPKNLFVIAYEKDRNDLINDICLFPYYISRLDSINCPTIGPNAPIGSNSDYYCTLLNAFKYYVREFSDRVNQHLNGVLQPNLQNELEQEFHFLEKATMNDIKQKINQYDDIHTFKTQVDVLNRISERQTNINTINNMSSKTLISNGNEIFQQNNYFNQQYVPQENEQLLVQ